MRANRYTGFTEEELKGTTSAAADLNNKDMTDWGKPKEGSVNSEQTTNAFVALLIVFPSALLFLGIAIFGPPALFP